MVKSLFLLLVILLFRGEKTKLINLLAKCIKTNYFPKTKKIFFFKLVNKDNCLCITCRYIVKQNKKNFESKLMIFLLK